MSDVRMKVRNENKAKACDREPNPSALPSWYGKKVKKYNISLVLGIHEP